MSPSTGTRPDWEPTGRRYGQMRPWVAALVTLVLLAGPTVFGGGRRASAAGGGLEFMGELPVPKTVNYVTPLLVDPLNRRLYARWDLTAAGGGGARTAEYDLSTDIPKVRRLGPLPSEGSSFIGLSSNTVTLDAGRKRAFVLDHPQSGDCPGCSVVKFWDLATLTVKPQTWNLTMLVPNFSALGITYSAQDDRVYAVGTLAGVAGDVMSQAVGPPYLPTAVVAVDASTGTLAWVRLLPECQHPAVVHPGLGASIFRSRRLSALYVPCIRPEPGLFNAGTYPGQSALIRLWIQPTATTTAASGFRREVFSISGVYYNGAANNGLAVFDEAADRVYMLNQSSGTSGAWAFDGLLSAWVGFVPAEDNTNWQLGVDQGSGHVYMRYGLGGDAAFNSSDPLLVTDGRATPVPQGDLFPTGISGVSQWIRTDPRTHRLFFQVSGRRAGVAPLTRVLVYKDRLPSAEPDRPIDYDGLTTDVAEGPGTFATYQGSVKGFGARVSLVGGYSGVLSPLYQSVTQRILIPGVKPAPRSIILGRAASLDLSSVSAASTAQAVAPDTVSADEYESYRNDLGKSAGGAAALGTEQLTWPWQAAVCIDAEQKAADDKKEAPVGRSTVKCDLKAGRVSASTMSGGAVLEGISLEGGTFVSSVERNEDGTVTEATATARGMEIDLPGVGRLSIGRVSSTVRTVAHGRPGTAGVKWVREIDGVLLTDPSGKVLFRCPEACSPEAVADAVNENIGERVRVVVPDAERIATPRGAFAGIRETKSSYFDGLVVNDDDSRAVPALELLVINDTAEKSRLDIQLAAIEASSIYGISLLPAEGGSAGPPLVDVPAIPPITNVGPPELAPPPIVSGGQVPALATTSSSVLAVRSPADALFLSLISLLILATIAGGVRRHRFAALLNGGPQR
jgi:hypothetical protein